MTRAEHLRWAKDRALEYAAMGDGANAFASIVSDLGKHPETESSVETAGTLGMMMLLGGQLSSQRQITEFIEGFN